MKSLNSKPKTKDFLAAALIVMTGLLVVTLSVFFFNIKNSTSINRFNNLVIAENSKETAQFLKVNEHYMLELDDNFIAIIKYDPSSWPFAFACGTQVMSGNSVNFPYQDGPYYYAKNGDSYRILNIETDEYNANASSNDLTALGLTLDPSKELTQDRILNNLDQYEPLSVQKESCLDITAAFMILYVFLLPPFLFLTFKKK